MTRIYNSLIYLCLLTFITLPTPVFSQKTEDEVLKVEVRRFEAMTQNDWDVLEEVLAEDLIYTHSNAKVDSKSQYIADLKAGKVKYNSIQPEDVKVRMYGNGSIGIVTGKAVMEITQNEQAITNNLRYTDVYVKRKGKWQLVSWQSTKIPE